MQQVEEEAASTDTSTQSVLSECPFELPRQFSSDSSWVLDCCLIQGHQGRWQNNYKIENHVQVSGELVSGKFNVFTRRWIAKG